MKKTFEEICNEYKIESKNDRGNAYEAFCAVLEINKQNKVYFWSETLNGSDCGIDLVVISQGKFVPIQCKSGKVDNKSYDHHLQNIAKIFKNSIIYTNRDIPKYKTHKNPKNIIVTKDKKVDVNNFKQFRERRNNKTKQIYPIFIKKYFTEKSLKLALKAKKIKSRPTINDEPSC